MTPNGWEKPRRILHRSDRAHRAHRAHRPPPELVVLNARVSERLTPLEDEAGVEHRDHRLARGTSSPLTQIWISAFRGSSAWLWVPRARAPRVGVATLPQLFPMTAI